MAGAGAVVGFFGTGTGAGSVAGAGAAAGAGVAVDLVVAGCGNAEVLDAVASADPTPPDPRSRSSEGGTAEPGAATEPSGIGLSRRDSSTIKSEITEERKINPKRMQREINNQLQNKV